MKSLVATILASAVSAACEHDHEKYHSFSHSLAQFEFDWEPYTVTTEDGYLLTMFRLQGPIGNVPVYREAKQSVLVMPGIGMSADSWFNSPLYGEPMPIALYQAGYDVWLGNNRGTHHSLKHMEFDHVHDAEEYWNFSFAEMGERDLPAMMKTIKYTAQQDVDNPRILHSDKLLYIGYDQGATQLLYGLAYMEEEFFKEYVRGAILMAPCVKMNVLQGNAGYKYYGDLIREVDMIGLYGMYGHNWEVFKPEICAHLGKDWCQQDRLWEEDSFSARSLAHFFQNGIEGRFQEFSEAYEKGIQQRVTSDVPIHKISHVPLAVFYGDADRVCPMEQVEWMMDQIGHLVFGNYQFGGYDHSDFGKASGDVFVQQLNEVLSHLDPQDGGILGRYVAEEGYAFSQEYQMREREARMQEELEHYMHGDPFKHEHGQVHLPDYYGEDDDDEVVDPVIEKEKTLFDSTGFDLRPDRRLPLETHYHYVQ